jgi:hypothetical protein
MRILSCLIALTFGLLANAGGGPERVFHKVLEDGHQAEVWRTARVEHRAAPGGDQELPEGLVFLEGDYRVETYSLELISSSDGRGRAIWEREVASPVEVRGSRLGTPFVVHDVIAAKGMIWVLFSEGANFQASAAIARPESTGAERTVQLAYRTVDSIVEGRLAIEDTDVVASLETRLAEHLRWTLLDEDAGLTAVEREP